MNEQQPSQLDLELSRIIGERAFHVTQVPLEDPQDIRIRDKIDTEPVGSNQLTLIQL